MAQEIEHIKLSTDLSIAPYFDDYDMTKDYHKILFKPAVAVQDRELNQMQTMLQNQMQQYASHIWKDGSILKGGAYHIDLAANYVKISDYDNVALPVSVNSFMGLTVTNAANVKAIVTNVFDGLEAQAPDTKTLIIKYTSAGANGEKTFAANDILITNNFNCVVLAANDSIGKSATFKISEGVVFAKGFPVYFPDESVVLSKYNNTPTCITGFVVNEAIVTSLQDPTLLDNAAGFPNVAAPGADRLKLTANLQVFATNSVSGISNTPNGFIHCITVYDGILQDTSERPQYADILDEWARRSYETNGDFVVRGMATRIKPHLNIGSNEGFANSISGGNNLLLVAGIEPGSCFVKGYDYEFLTTRWLPLDKGTDVEYIEDATISANYGNYIEVNELSGCFDVANCSLASFYNSPQLAVTTETYSNTVLTGTLIGTARVKNVMKNNAEEGAAAGYRVYVYDVTLIPHNLSGTGSIANNSATLIGNNTLFTTEVGIDNQIYIENRLFIVNNITNNTLLQFTEPANKTYSNVVLKQALYTFSDTKSIRQEVGSGGVAAMADIVLESNVCVIKDINHSSHIFRIQNEAVKTIRSIDSVVATGYFFEKWFDTAMNSDGTFTLYSSDAKEIFPFSQGTLDTVERKNHVKVIILDDIDSASVPELQYHCGQLIDMGADSSLGTDRSINCPSVDTLEFDIGEELVDSVALRVGVLMKRDIAQELRKIKKPDRYVQINLTTNANTIYGPWCLGFADIYEIHEVRYSNTVFVSNTAGIDVTSNFILDNGQSPQFYNLGYLKVKSPITYNYYSTGYLLVRLSYFAMDTADGIGYSSVDSYPIDDVNGPANSYAIQTKDIPIYFSDTHDRYDLRNCIDVRTRMLSTAFDAITVASATINPTSNTNINVPSSGLHSIIPDSFITFDYTYYLGRKDLIVVGQNGKLAIVRGQARRDRITPQPLTTSMSLSVIDIPPYPSISAAEAQQYTFDVPHVSITPDFNRRYTMRDVGAIDKRLKNVEYYVALNNLETAAKSMQILDENGLNRFKNGIFTDTFQGTGVGDVSDAQFNASIDMANNELRPSFSLRNVSLRWDRTISENVVNRSTDVRLNVLNTSYYHAGDTVTQGGSSAKVIAVSGYPEGFVYCEQASGTFSNNATLLTNGNTYNSIVTDVALPYEGDLVTLPYTHELLAEQQFASTTRNIGGLEWHFSGILQLFPNIDVWVDVNQLPDITTTTDLNYAAWKNLPANGAWTTTWNSWQLTSTGVVNKVVSSNSYTVNTSSKVVTTSNSVVGTTTHVSYQNTTSSQVSSVPYSNTTTSGTANTSAGSLSNAAKATVAINSYYNMAGVSWVFDPQPTASTYQMRMAEGDYIRFASQNTGKYRPSPHGLNIISYYWVEGSYTYTPASGGGSSGSSTTSGVVTTVTKSFSSTKTTVNVTNTKNSTSILNINASTTYTNTGTKTDTTYNYQSSGDADRLAGYKYTVTSSENKLLDVALIPYMRPRTITFIAKGLKPGSIVYPFFDGVDVGAWCGPLNGISIDNVGKINVTNTNVYIDGYALPNGLGNNVAFTGVLSNPVGVDLKVNSRGDLIGVFYIPTKRFTVGTKKFRLTDSITNADKIGEVTTSAEAYYMAYGLMEYKQAKVGYTREGLIDNRDLVDVGTQSTSAISYSTASQTVYHNTYSNVVTYSNSTSITNTTISTSNTQTRKTTNVSNTGSSTPYVAASASSGFGWATTCPIAQEFIIQLPNDVEGTFLSKVWLYFAQKSDDWSVEIELREMDAGGNITQVVVPFSKCLLYPNDIKVSHDGTAPTIFTFPDLVYLLNNTRYAMVVRPTGGNPYFSVWIGELGGEDILTKERIFKKPYVGNFYVSSNDQEYSIMQDEKLKFKLFRAKFNTAVSGSLFLDNGDAEIIPIANYAPLYGNPIIIDETRLVLANIELITPGDTIYDPYDHLVGTVTYVNTEEGILNLHNPNPLPYVGATTNVAASNSQTIINANVNIVHTVNATTTVNINTTVTNQHTPILSMQSTNYETTNSGLLLYATSGSASSANVKLMASVSGSKDLVAQTVSVGGVDTTVYTLKSNSAANVAETPRLTIV